MPDCLVLGYESLADGLTPAAIVNVLHEQAHALKNPKRTVPDLLETLRACGLVQSVAKLNELFSAG